MKCPICNEGELVKPTRPIPDWLTENALECTECGDMIDLTLIKEHDKN